MSVCSLSFPFPALHSSSQDLVVPVGEDVEPADAEALEKKEAAEKAKLLERQLTVWSSSDEDEPGPSNGPSNGPAQPSTATAPAVVLSSPSPVASMRSSLRVGMSMQPFVPIYFTHTHTHTHTICHTMSIILTLFAVLTI